MKRFLPVVLLAACAGLVQASAIESLSIDLSALHAGSVLSGSVTLANPLQVGDSTQIDLAFSDPSDYSPVALTSTLSIETGTTGDAVRFSPITFTNLATNKVFTLMVAGAAQCVPSAFPCQASGRFEANSPPVFTGTYTFTAEEGPSSVPEPSYGLLLTAIVTGAATGRRFIR